jgi:intracellular multiplication protein IcmK
MNKKTSIHTAALSTLIAMMFLAPVCTPVWAQSQGNNQSRSQDDPNSKEYKPAKAGAYTTNAKSANTSNTANPSNPYLPAAPTRPTGPSAPAYNGGNTNFGAAPMPLARQSGAGQSAPNPTKYTKPDLLEMAVDATIPMTPAQMKSFMEKLLENQRAISANITGTAPPRAITSVEQVDLSPGATPPVIRLALGQGSTLSFMDAAGRPWPIADNLNFNGRAYNAQLLAPHLYAVTLLSKEIANLSIVLKGLPRPIVITVVPALDETDYLKEYTIPKFLDGLPPASIAASAKDGAQSFNSAELLDFLYRTPPKDAKSLTVKGLSDVMAWQTGSGKMVVRTSGMLVIPAFLRRHTSADVSVFELPLSPVVSITQNGSLHRVSIQGYTVDSAKIPSATSIASSSSFATGSAGGGVSIKSANSVTGANGANGGTGANGGALGTTANGSLGVGTLNLPQMGGPDAAAAAANAATGSAGPKSK